MTTVITENQTANGDSDTVPVESGQYLIAAGGVFDGGSVQINVNIGPATGVPVDGAVYTEPKAEVIWLPDCTVFATLTGATSPNVSIVVSPLVTQFKD